VSSGKDADRVKTETKNDGGGEYLVIHQPNMLRRKVGRLVVDAAALERAEAALRALAVSYPEELQRGAKAAQAAWEVWSAALDDATLRQALASIVHDIKGQAGSFDFPLATEIARSLGIVLRNNAERIAALRPVVEAHLGALQAVASQGITGDGGAQGAALIAGLRKTLEKFGLDPDDGVTPA
jgi:HPt (histidine-containing phosphotransfer) domain-containing protein